MSSLRFYYNARSQPLLNEIRHLLGEKGYLVECDLIENLTDPGRLEQHQEHNMMRENTVFFLVHGDDLDTQLRKSAL